MVYQSQREVSRTFPKGKRAAEMRDLLHLGILNKKINIKDNGSQISHYQTRALLLRTEILKES